MEPQPHKDQQVDDYESVPTEAIRSRPLKGGSEIEITREYRELEAVAEHNHRAAKDATQRYLAIEAQIQDLETQLSFAKTKMREIGSKNMTLSQLESLPGVQPIIDTTLKPHTVNISASAKAKASAENPTEDDESRGLDRFRQFANAERARIAERKRTQASQDRTTKLNELKRFSTNFKLRTPVPSDLIGILAKDSIKQEAIIKEAQTNSEQTKSTSNQRELYKRPQSGEEPLPHRLRLRSNINQESFACNLTATLYKQCVSTLRFHLQRIKRSDWELDQLDAIRHNLAQLILWGEDMWDGQLEAFLVHSASLTRSVLEVFSSLGAALVTDSFLETQQLRDNSEAAISNLRLLLVRSQSILLDMDNDGASTISDAVSSDYPIVDPKKIFVEDLEHYVKLLFQMAPSIEAISNSLPLHVPHPQDILEDQRSMAVAEYVARSGLDFWQARGTVDSLSASTVSSDWREAMQTDSTIHQPPKEIYDQFETIIASKRALIRATEQRTAIISSSKRSDLSVWDTTIMEVQNALNDLETLIGPIRRDMKRHNGKIQDSTRLAWILRSSKKVSAINKRLVEATSRMKQVTGSYT